MVTLPCAYILCLVYGQCISLVRKHYPDANGAEFSNIGGGWCNAVFGAVGVIFDPSVQTCIFEDVAHDCACP